MPVEIAGETYWTLLELVALFPRAARPSAETLRRHMRTGKLTATKVGRGSLISSSAVRQFLDGAPPGARAPAVPAGEPERRRRRPAKPKGKFRHALALARRADRTKRKSSSASKTRNRTQPKHHSILR
jgi:hypothetical protein